MLFVIADEITHVVGMLRAHACSDNRIRSALTAIEIKPGACFFITLQFLLK